MVDVAEIKIWGELAGAVRWNERLQLASFQFAPKFLNQAWDLSPIKLPLDNASRIYSFPELRKGKDDAEDTFKGLPGLLADSLPDKYGNQLINVWLAQQGRPANSMNPVEQLCFIGSRGMGAIEFEPTQLKATKKAFDIEISSLVALAQKMQLKRESFHMKIELDEKKALTEILKIGTSAGGARPKAVIAYNELTKEVKSGQTNAPRGFEQWLIKLDGVSGAQFGESHGWGRVEYAYYLMAKECGIEMMESQLFEEDERAHFMTKRFDREGNSTKHHVQTLCGIRHFNYTSLYSYSYEQVFETMRILKLSYKEAEQMFRRMVFNVLATNCDDHTKNFSFRLRQGERWELAPAYDVCYSYDPKNIWVNQQTLSVNGKHRLIDSSDLLSIADANNIRKADSIIHEINTVVKQWQDFASTAKVRSDLKETIQENLHTFI